MGKHKKMIHEWPNEKYISSADETQKEWKRADLKVAFCFRLAKQLL